MLIVGYNDRQKIFIVRKSWGEHWGDKGYCYVQYDYAGSPDFNILNQFAILGLTKVDLTPDPDDGEDFDTTEDPTPAEHENPES